MWLSAYRHICTRCFFVWTQVAVDESSRATSCWVPVHRHPSRGRRMSDCINYTPLTPSLLGSVFMQLKQVRKTWDCAYSVLLKWRKVMYINGLQLPGRLNGCVDSVDLWFLQRQHPPHPLLKELNKCMIVCFNMLTCCNVFIELLYAQRFGCIIQDGSILGLNYQARSPATSRTI